MLSTSSPVFILAFLPQSLLTSSLVPLQTDVYWSDPLSVFIFNTIVCTMIDALKPPKHQGYNFLGTKHLVHLLQYADDTRLGANGPSSCQKLVKRWLHWSCIKAKVPKCHSVGVQFSIGRSFDPCLTLHIPFISSNPIKFLGYRIQVPVGQVHSQC